MTVPYTFANRTGNIPLSELDANFSNVSAFVSTAGTVTSSAQPNIASVGTLSSLTVSGSGSMGSLSVSGNLVAAGNVTAGNIIGTLVGNISNAVYATTAGTVTTNAQPNITSVGLLTTLVATGNISTTGNIIVTGNVNPGNVESTGLVRGLTVLATGNLVGGNANISNSVNAFLVTAANISAVRIATTGSVSIGNLLSVSPQTKAANATGTTGQICWDSDYIYVCTATDTWKRAQLFGGY
jgi:hypothetical protein